MRNSLHLFAVLELTALVGCSTPAENAKTTTSSGGAGTGGDSSQSGGLGGTTSGSAGTTGGSMASGGSNAAAAGGVPATGGTVSTGGAGGSTSGGAPSTGGTPSASGAGGSSLGGASAGGSLSTGGAPPLGGAPGAGDGGTSQAGGGAGATSSGGAAGAAPKKFIGNIAPKNKDIPANFADKWMQMSMEANSKWGFVQPSSADQWTWEPVDQAHQYAKDHGIIFKQHNFFWNFEQPSWVTSSNVATVGPLWVKEFCERYPDIEMIDVVNEPMHNPAPYASGMGGAGESGWDWVVNAFKWARESCPNAILIINEFNIIEYDSHHDDFVAMLQKLLDAGAPIDAIGAQGHDVYKIGAAKSKTYLDDFTAKFPTLPIYITEVDIDLTDDAEQKTSMEEEITMFWDHPNVRGITYWGFTQGSTWRTNAWLVSTSGVERPAMVWLQEFIAAHR